MKKIFTLFIALFAFSAIQAQTAADVRLVGDANGAKYNVAVYVSFDVASGLGASNIRMTFDESVIDNPMFVSTPMNASYSVDASEPNPGIASVNVVAIVGTPHPIPVTGVADALIAVIEFDVTGDPITDVADIDVKIDAVVPSTEVFDWDGTAFGGQTAITNFTAQNIQGASLPLELTSFDVVKNTENSAKLAWTTEIEEAFSHFELQRSMDGVNFRPFADVQGKGYNAGVNKYSEIDANIPFVGSSETTVYYRLKMIDLDGKYEFSEIRSVMFDERVDDVTVFPNPTADYIAVKADSEISNVTIYNIDGRVVLNQKVGGQIDMTSHDSGIYKVLVTSEAGTVTKTVIKLD